MIASVSTDQPRLTLLRVWLGVMICSFVLLFVLDSTVLAADRGTTASTQTLSCQPPIFLNGLTPAVPKAHCSAFTFDFNASEGGNLPAADPVSYSTSIGTINASTGQLTVPALPGCGTTSVTVTATNSCSAQTQYSFDIQWTNNVPVISNIPLSQLSFSVGRSTSYDFNSIDTDPCDAVAWTVTALGPVVEAPSITATGVFSWRPAESERGSLKSFIVTITDPCGGTVSDTIVVSVVEIEPFAFAIAGERNAQLGNIEQVSIIKDAGEASLGGFNFLIAYDTAPLSFVSAEPGSGLGENGCGWEYFNYQFISYGENCDSNCVGALVRVSAIADLNTIAGAPACNLIPNGAELVKLRFYLTTDRRYECWFFPIRFAWRDCHDNTATSVAGDTLYLSQRVYDFDSYDPFPYLSDEITDTTCHAGISYGGACSQCDTAVTPLARNIYFHNGGIDQACVGMPYYGGDLNLNRIAYEIGDASLYASYFTYGLAVFLKNTAEQILESDANNDGVALHPSDLSYILRVIAGDALPFATLSPFSALANVDALGGNIAIASPVKISAIEMVFDITGRLSISNHTNLQLDSAERDGKLHVLLWTGLENLSKSIPAGLHEILSVDGAVLSSIQLSDYDGNALLVNLSRQVLPTQFALSQNFPNPFNPVTRINIDLPQASDWTLDVYNLSGQRVKHWSGLGVGIVPVEWDASNEPSGVYFYRLTAGSFVASRKMVLLK